jgi:hypothetical protein
MGWLLLEEIFATGFEHRENAEGIERRDIEVAEDLESPAPRENPSTSPRGDSVVKDLTFQNAQDDEKVVEHQKVTQEGRTEELDESGVENSGMDSTNSTKIRSDTIICGRMRIAIGQEPGKGQKSADSKEASTCDNTGRQECGRIRRPGEAVGRIEIQTDRLTEGLEEFRVGRDSTVDSGGRPEVKEISYQNAESPILAESIWKSNGTVVKLGRSFPLDDAYSQIYRCWRLSEHQVQVWWAESRGEEIDVWPEKITLRVEPSSRSFAFYAEIISETSDWKSLIVPIENSDQRLRKFEVQVVLRN